MRISCSQTSTLCFKSLCKHRHSLEIRSQRLQGTLAKFSPTASKTHQAPEQSGEGLQILLTISSVLSSEMMMTSSATTMEQAIGMMSTDLENEPTAIWIPSMGSIAKEERLSKRGSPDFMNRFNLEAHPGAVIGSTYVRPTIKHTLATVTEI